MACFLAIRFIRISSLSCWRYSFTYLSALLKISLRFSLRIFQKIKRSVKLQNNYQSINCDYHKANTFPTEKEYFEYFFIIVLHYYTHFGCTLEWKYGSPVEAKFHHKNSSECKLVYYNAWICDGAGWSKSCVSIGTPIYSGFPALVCHIINPL